MGFIDFEGICLIFKVGYYRFGGFKGVLYNLS